MGRRISGSMVKGISVEREKNSLRTVKFPARLERERSRLICHDHNQSFTFLTRPTASAVDIFMQLPTARLEQLFQ